MPDVIRAELFKLVRRPAAWTLLGCAAVLNGVFAYLIPYLAYASGDGGGGGPADVGSPEQALASTLPDQIVANTLGGFPVFAGALALVLGVLMFGGEHALGTVKTLFTQGPGRLRVAAGQLAALGVALAVGLVVLFAAGAAVSAVIAVAEGRPADWPGAADLALGFLAGWLILFVWAAVGAAAGTGLRGVALPIGLGVVWVLGVENLVSAMAGSLLDALEPVRDVLPGVNAGSLVYALLTDRAAAPPPGVSLAVGESRAWLTLCLYAAACLAVTLWLNRRRDVA